MQGNGKGRKMKRFRKRLATFKTNCTFAREKIYAPLGQRWSVNPFAFSWRTRFLSIRLFTNMGLWLARNPIDYGVDIDDCIREWRGSSTVGNIITRNAIVLAVQQKHFTTAQLEVACGAGAKRTTIKKMLSTGVEMDLLTRDEHWRYHATNKLILTSFWRVLVKLMDPDVIAFCRYVVMFDEVRKSAQYVGEMEKTLNYQGNFLTMHEQLFNGEFDDELFEDGEYDPDDTYDYDDED